MITVAKNSGADFVKFQKRDNKLLLGEDYHKPHPVPENSYAKTYGKHRDFLEFDYRQHLQLIKFCKKIKIGYSISVWDTNSAKELSKKKYGLSYIKVPSACNLNFDLLKILRDDFRGKIHISTGMTKRTELKKIVTFLKKKNRLKDTVIYTCTSDYPAKIKDTCLLEINNLQKLNKKISAIGFSGHHSGIAIDNAAVVLGAKFFERHFTLDRSWKGTDHAASLEPSGLQKLKRDLMNTYSALKYKPSNGFLNCETFQRKKLKKNQISF